MNNSFIGGKKLISDKQKEVTKEDTKKGQPGSQEMKLRKPALARPKGRNRAKPGTKGEGEYFHIIVRPKEEFATFRTQDVGEKGHILRLAGKRSSGSWDTHAWLISKDDAHMEGDQFVADTDDGRKLIEGLGSKPTHVEGNVFEVKDRPNVPERKKPTEAQQKARLENIKKAQQARRSRLAKNE